MAKKPSLKDKVLTADKIEAAYEFLNKKTESEPTVEAAQEIQQKAELQMVPTKKTPKPKAKQNTKRTIKTEHAEPILESQEPNVRVTVDMPAQLHEDMKIMTIRRRETIRSFILKLIEKEVAKGR